MGCGYEDRIGKKAFEIYTSPESNIYISQISFWKMAIKINIGKLNIPIGLKNIIDLTRQAGIDAIPVKNSHILYYQTFEVLEKHQDPFDRFIIATALCEEMKIISSDTNFDYYAKLDRIWED